MALDGNAKKIDKAQSVTYDFEFCITLFVAETGFLLHVTHTWFYNQPNIVSHKRGRYIWAPQNNFLSSDNHIKGGGGVLFSVPVATSHSYFKALWRCWEL